VFFCGKWLRSHDPHERANGFAPDPHTLEQIAQHPGPGERQFQMQLVDPAHPPKIFGRM